MSLLAQNHQFSNVFVIWDIRPPTGDLYYVVFPFQVYFIVIFLVTGHSTRYHDFILIKNTQEPTHLHM